MTLLHTLNTDRTNLTPVGAGNALPTSQGLILATYTFTRPNNTTAYGNNGLIANDTVAANVALPTLDLTNLVPAGAVPQIVQARLRVSGQTSSPATTVYLFNAPPTLTIGDGGTFTQSANAGYASYLTSFTLGSPSLFSDGGMVTVQPSNAFAQLAPTGTKLYAILTASGPWTPTVASQTITIELVLRP